MTRQTKAIRTAQRAFSAQSANKPLCGIVGYRGMVGSVLMDRMQEEGDLDCVKPVFFSTSQAGTASSPLGDGGIVEDSNCIESLKAMDMIISCQGGDYTKHVHPALREQGWNGYWIDAASSLRMEDTATIVLDPVNRTVIDKAIASGVKDFAGGNCTVSLMLMAMHGLYERGLVEWVSAATYQAASGAGAANMKELLYQMGHLYENSDLDAPILELDAEVSSLLRGDDMPVEKFGVPLAASLLPFIDRLMPNGQSREEWKAFAESNKILGLEANPVPVDGTCVRVGALRCHSQALTVKLTKNVPLEEIEQILQTQNEWVSYVPNNKESTITDLTPTKITGTLNIGVGRVRKMNLGDEYLSMFTVGDQLLWGAAEPLRRTLRIIVGNEP